MIYDACGSGARQMSTITAMGEVNYDACGSSARAQKLHRESTAVARSNSLVVRDQELCISLRRKPKRYGNAREEP